MVARPRASLLLLVSRSFKSRAHPKPIPDYSVRQAVQMVLEDVEERKTKRVERWERNASARAEKAIKVNTEICRSSGKLIFALIHSLYDYYIRTTVRIEIRMKRLNLH